MASSSLTTSTNRSPGSPWSVRSSGTSHVSGKAATTSMPTPDNASWRILARATDGGTGGSLRACVFGPHEVADCGTPCHRPSHRMLPAEPDRECLIPMEIRDDCEHYRASGCGPSAGRGNAVRGVSGYCRNSSSTGCAAHAGRCLRAYLGAVRRARPAHRRRLGPPWRPPRRHGGTVATNRPEFHWVDVAAMHLGATSFGVYNTFAQDQVEHVLRDANCAVAVTEQAFADTLGRASRACPRLTHIVSVDGGENMLSLDEVDAAGDPGF